MDISILICTRNRADSLRETLAAFAALEPPASRKCELIVVDNGSTDHTQEVVAQNQRHPLPVRYMFARKPGLSNARNAGMMAAQGEIIVFTDDDVRPAEHWLERLCAPLASGQAHASAGGIDIAPHLRRSWMTRYHRSILADTERLEAEVAEKGAASLDEVVGANMAFLRTVLNSESGFDPELGAGASGFAEETLFAWQLRAAGYVIAPAFDARVEHHFAPDRLTRQNWISNARKLGRSFAYIDYHWKRTPVSDLRLTLLKRSLRLAYWRHVRRKEWPHREGASEWEINLTMHIHYLRRLWEEKGKPRLL